MDKSEFIEQLKHRTKKLAVEVILFYDSIKKTEATKVVGYQIIK